MLALLLLFFILFPRSRSFLPNRYGELQAANIDPAFIGETVLFTCVITDDSLPVNSSAIWIRRSNSNTSVGSVVNRTATSATIEVKVTSLSDAGVYYCTLTIPGEHLDVTYIIVAVEYPLAPVTDLNCTVPPGSTQLECEYTLPRPYLYPDAIVGCVFYYPRFHTELRNICYNGTDRNFSLSEGHDLFLDYIFEIRLQYNGRKVAKMSKNFSVVPMEVVIPPPVENVNVTERRATRLQLSWKELDVYVAYIYRVTYTAVWGNEKQISTVQTNSTTILLRELSPFTNYSVLVQARERHLLAGYWSQGDPVTVKTLDDVPGRAPRVSPAVSRTDGGGVVVYWQPLSPKEENGEMQGYRVQCGDEDARRVGPGGFSETLDTPTDRRGLWCDVYAVNNVGMSNSSSLYIPSRRSELTPRDFWVVSGEGDTNITFLWDSVGREQHNCAAYWCQAADQADMCQTPVQWETVTCDQQSLTLDTGHVITDQRLMVGFSEELSGGHIWSTIQWQYCIYAPHKVPPAPDEFRLSPNQPPLGVHVMWRPPDCRQNPAHITNYILSYCLVPSAGNCSGSSGTRVVDGDAVSYLISDLEPGADYKVNIRAVSQVLQGPWSTPVIGRVEDAANPLKIILAVTGCFIFVLVTSSCFIVGKRARSSWMKGHTYSYPPFAPDEARVLLNDHGPCSRVDPGEVVAEVTEDGGPVRVVQEVTEDGGPVRVVQEVTEDGGPVHVVKVVTEDGGDHMVIDGDGGSGHVQEKVIEDNRGPGHVIGEVTEDNGGPGHVIGEVTEDNGGPGHVIGEVTEDNGGPGHVIGEVTEDNGGPGHVIGEVTEDNGGPGHVIGEDIGDNGGPGHVKGKVTEDNGGPGHVIGEVTEDNGGPDHVIGEDTGDNGGPGHVKGKVTEDNGGPGHVIGEVSEDNGGPGHVIGEVSEDNGGPGHVIGEVTEHNGGPGHVIGEVTEHNGGPGHVIGEVTEDNGGTGHVIEEVIVDNGGAVHLVGEVRDGGKGTVGESEPQTPNEISMHLQNDHVSAYNSEYVFDMSQSYSMLTLREEAGC